MNGANTNRESRIDIEKKKRFKTVCRLFLSLSEG
jgi:hypothetical protein